MSTALLIFHGILSVALLGALTHQAAGLLWSPQSGRPETFPARYSRAGRADFSVAVALLYLVNVILGALIYPAYRVDARISFEEMNIPWAVGVFEIKEHFSAIGLAMLPLYRKLCRDEFAASHRIDRTMIVMTLTLIAWWDFVVGHILNNIRGIA